MSFEIWVPIMKSLLWNFDKCSSDCKVQWMIHKNFLFPLKNNPLCGIVMFVLLMNGQPQALQQLPVSVVNLVYDVQWEYDDKLKPTINFILFDYIRIE